jgi:hypothetical protein
MITFDDYKVLNEAEKKQLTGGIWKRMARGGSIYTDHDGNIIAGGNPALKDKIKKMQNKIHPDNLEKVEIDEIIRKKTYDLIDLIQLDNLTELRKDYPTISENVIKVFSERETALHKLEQAELPKWSLNQETAKVEREFSRKMGWLARADSYNDIANAITKGVSDISEIIVNELGAEANKKIQKIMDDSNNTLNAPAIDTIENNWLKNGRDEKVLTSVKEMLKENPLSEIDENIFIK